MAQNLIAASCGMFGIGAAMIGYCLAPMRWYERIWFIIGSLLLIDPGTLTDVIGLIMLFVGILYEWRKRRDTKAVLDPSILH